MASQQAKDKMNLNNLEDCGKSLSKIKGFLNEFRENGMTVLGQVRLFLAEDYQNAIGSADDLLNKVNSEIGAYNSTVKSRLQEWERSNKIEEHGSKKNKKKNSDKKKEEVPIEVMNSKKSMTTNDLKISKSKNTVDDEFEYEDKDAFDFYFDEYINVPEMDFQPKSIEVILEEN